MKCPRCDTENPEQARFCLACGDQLVLVCPQCRTELPPNAKFCFACGTTVVVPPPDAVRERDSGAPVLSEAEGCGIRFLWHRIAPAGLFLGGADMDRINIALGWIGFTGPTRLTHLTSHR